jgi:hypothetical protein
MLEADNLVGATYITEQAPLTSSRYVLLCGGLGSSQYVRTSLTELFSRPGTSAIPHARVIDLLEP